MSEVNAHKLSELLRAADERRIEDIRALVPEQEFGTEKHWREVIASEAAEVYDRMQTLYRRNRVPAFLKGTNVQIMHQGFDGMEDESYTTPLLLESPVEHAETEVDGVVSYHAVTTGLTAIGCLFTEYGDKNRTLDIKQWIVDRSPHGVRVASRPDLIGYVAFGPNGKPRGKRTVDGIGFWDFKQEWFDAEKAAAHASGEKPDYALAERDITYPDELYVDVLGSVRALKKALHTKIEGQENFFPEAKGVEELDWAWLAD